jgi:hypothetical protein
MILTLGLVIISIALPIVVVIGSSTPFPLGSRDARGQSYEINARGTPVLSLRLLSDPKSERDDFGRLSN